MRCGVPHRWLVVPLAAAILYGAPSALASEAAVSSPAPPPPSLNAPLPLPANAGAPVARGEAAPQLSAPTEIPHIALLLPLDSGAFGRHAEAVKNGFLAAAKIQGRTALPIRIYATGDDVNQIVEIYARALANGARLVVGPLARDGVTALVESAVVIVPTLALNVPESNTPLPRELFTLSLQAEAEARQVAQLAYQEGYRKAFTVHDGTPLMKRIHQAFVEEFTRLGGAHIASYAFTSDPAGLARLKRAAGQGGADMAFLALDLPRARLARPYFDPLALYATSQVYPGNAGPLASFDLAGVSFLDMPWLLQPDHPAVMVYPRPDYRDTIELERFYALGIDAFRLAQELLAGDIRGALDGVTGRLTLGRDQQFVRALTAAQFNQGKIVVRREARP